MLEAFLVAQAARELRHAQVAGIDEAHELRAFVVEDGGGFRRVGRRAPVFGVERLDVAGDHAVDDHVLRALARVAAVAIRAAEHDKLRLVHRLDAVMAFEAAAALGVGLGLGLVDPVARGQTGAGKNVQVVGDGKVRPQAGAGAFLGGEDDRRRQFDGRGRQAGRETGDGGGRIGVVRRGRRAGGGVAGDDGRRRGLAVERDRRRQHGRVRILANGEANGLPRRAWPRGGTVGTTVVGVGVGEAPSVTVGGIAGGVGL